MKQTLFFLIMFLMSHIGSKAQDFTLTGKVTFKEPAEKVLLSYRNGDERIADSADIKNGTFNFKGKVIEPTLAILSIRFPKKASEKRARTERMQLFLEAGNIHVTAKDSLEFAKVTGSKAQKEFDAYNKLIEPYKKQEASFGPRYQKISDDKNVSGMQSIQDEYEAMMKDRNEKVIKPYIQSHPSSPIVVTLLNQFVGYDIDLAVAEPLFNALSDANKNSFSGKSLQNRIDIAKKTAVGAMAMNFTQNDTLERPVSLADFKGKYVLLDFWASWCGPCRAENPNVVKAFNQYKDKNFAILGVSLDQPGKKQAWLDAIHKDGLWWNQVSDLKGWDNEVAGQYGIRAIPQNLLLDPSGKIIAKNIRGEELAKKLEEVLE